MALGHVGLVTLSCLLCFVSSAISPAPEVVQGLTSLLEISSKQFSVCKLLLHFILYMKQACRKDELLYHFFFFNLNLIDVTQIALTSLIFLMLIRAGTFILIDYYQSTMYVISYSL